MKKNLMSSSRWSSPLISSLRCLTTYWKRSSLLVLLTYGLLPSHASGIAEIKFPHAAAAHKRELLDFSTLLVSNPTCKLNFIGFSRLLGDGDSQSTIGDSTSDDEDGDDFVSIVNFSSVDIDISGWELYVDQRGTSTPVFTFPSSTTITPCDEITVVADWNGSNPLPTNWFDANYNFGEGMFEETSNEVTYVILRDPIENEYITFYNTPTSPSLSTGTRVCGTSFHSLIPTDFDGCEMVFWNAGTNSYQVRTDCSIYSAYTGCTVPVEVCGNTLDDDGDGFVDCLDSDCPGANAITTIRRLD